MCLALVLAEASLRIWGTQLGQPRLPFQYSIGAIERLTVGDAYVRFDRELGWVPTERIERQMGDVRYRHNSAGLRANVEYDPQPPPNVRRYAAFGDSFTYCEEVPIESCWTSLLQRELDGSEVLNFGVPGYASDQAWLRYRRDGAAFQACVVMIGHMVENINRIENRFRPFYYPDTGIPLAKPRFVLEDGEPVLLPSPAETTAELKDPQWVEANLGPADRWYFPGTFVNNPLDSFQLVRLARTAQYRLGRDEAAAWASGYSRRVYQRGQEPFELLVAVLSGFAAEVRATGASPLVVILPLREEIIAARDEAPLPHAVLIEVLRERGVPFLDLSAALGAQARRSSMGNLIEQHYRPLANTVVARTLASELRRHSSPSCGGERVKG
jgi:hypothetical protein